jgi:hypothetical protein
MGAWKIKRARLCKPRAAPVQNPCCTVRACLLFRI